MGFKDVIKRYNPYNEINKLKEQLSSMVGVRPFNADFSQGSPFPIQSYPYPLTTLYRVAYDSDVLTIVHNALRQELFRNGFEVVEKWKADPDVEVLQPDLVENVDEEAMREERKRILEFFGRCNANGQTIVDVWKEIEDDLNIADNAYLLMLFEYGYGRNGDVVSKELQEVLRADPRVMQLVMNNQDIPGMDDDGKYLVSCPEDRQKVMRINEYDQENPPRHPIHGTVLYPVFYREKGFNGRETYYFEWEVVHRSRYRPSKKYGYSPLIPIYRKVFTLVFMDDYMKELYDGKRPPKGLLVARTANKASLKTAWEELLDQARANPHMVGLLGIQGSSTSGDSGRFAEFFDFMRSMEEMQFTEVRNEMRNQIGAVYGVTPLFQNDVSTSGGLNNEGRQITVTNRSAELKQADYNEYFFPAVLEALGVEYHAVILNPSEEQDEMAKLERLEKTLMVGEAATRLGLKAEYDADKQEVVIHSGPLEASAPETGFGGEDFGNPEDPGSDSNLQFGFGEPTGTPEEPSQPEEQTGVSKASLPPDVRPLGPNETPPPGAAVITGPKGGKYVRISGEEDSEESSSEGTGLAEYGAEDRARWEEAAKKAMEELEQEHPEALEKARASAQKWRDGDTSKARNSDPDGNYTEERQQLHQQILDSIFEGDKGIPPEGTQPQLIYLGGLPGSGKSSAILASMNTDDYVVIDSDAIKAQLPEYEGYNAPELHDEARDVTKLAYARAFAEGRSWIMDGTARNSSKLKKWSDVAKQNGYKAFYAGTEQDPERSIDNAKNRFIEQGRFVPFDFIINSYDGIDQARKEFMEYGDGYLIMDTNEWGNFTVAAQGGESHVN